MLPRIVRKINPFRVPLGVVVAASAALVIWVPVSGAASVSRPHLIRADEQRDTGASYRLSSSTVKVRTTAGKTRKETIQASEEGNSGEVSIQLSLSRHTSRSRRFSENEWGLGGLRASDLSIKGGNAVVRFTPAQVGPFGSLYGVFTHRSKTKETCSVSGSKYKYTGKFDVHERFRTRNQIEPVSKLGSVHGPTGTGGTITFANKLGKNTTKLIVDHACINKVTPPSPTKTYCRTGTSWESPLATIGDVDSDFYGARITTHSPSPSRQSYVFGERYLILKGLPSGGGYAGSTVSIARDDTVKDRVVAQHFSAGASGHHPEEVTITAAGDDGYVQGSAVLKSAKSTNNYNDGTCYRGSAHVDQYDQYGGPPFTWTNTSTRLKADSAVGGRIVVGNRIGDKSGSIDPYTTGIG